MGQTRPLLFLCFLKQQFQQLTIFITFTSKIQYLFPIDSIHYWDSNSWPLVHDSPSMPFFFFVSSTGIRAHDASFRSFLLQPLDQRFQPNISFFNNSFIHIIDIFIRSEWIVSGTEIGKMALKNLPLFVVVVVLCGSQVD